MFVLLVVGSTVTGFQMFFFHLCTPKSIRVWRFLVVCFVFVFVLLSFFLIYFQQTCIYFGRVYWSVIKRSSLALSVYNVVYKYSIQWLLFFFFLPKAVFIVVWLGSYWRFRALALSFFISDSLYYDNIAKFIITC